MVSALLALVLSQLAPTADAQRAFFNENASRYAPASYCASTSGTVSTGTALSTVTSVLYIWHPAVSGKRVNVHHIDVHGSAGNAGTYLLYIARIIAENGTPGGTVVTEAKLDTSQAAPTVTVRSGATGAPTREAGSLYLDSMSGGVELDVHVEAHMGMRGMILRAGQNEGIEVRTQVTNALSQPAAIAATICWTEENP